MATSPTLSLDSVQELLRTCLQKHVVVIGDVMLDEFIMGQVERICPEAPVQVLSEQESRSFLGGAGNVAANLAPFLGKVTLIGVTGDDAAREALIDNLAKIDCSAEGLIAAPSRRTTQKTRFVAQGIQLLRRDREDTHPLDTDTTDALLAKLDKALKTADVVVAADYNKGVLAEEVFAQVAERCKKQGVPLLVDPKRPEMQSYAGATLIKPNQKEAEAGFSQLLASAEALDAAGKAFLEQANAEAILITLGPRGMCLYQRDAEPLTIPTQAREVFDVTGAGDTTIAFVALALAGGWDFAQSAVLANTAAGITIAKRGTARVEPSELLQTVRRQGELVGNAGKRITVEEMAALGDSLRRQDKKIVFTNGCFDLFHGAHIELLQRARSLGDVLIVGLNDDASVARLKGSGRPFLSLDDRAGILAAFEFVDHLVVYESDEPTALIEALQPDILVKGGNYSQEEVVGADLVKQYGGEVHLITLTRDHSITELSQDIHRKLSNESLS